MNLQIRNEFFLKILFVTPYQPDLIRVRPFHLLKNLSALGHKITLVYYDSPAEMYPSEELRSICEEIYFYPLHKWQIMINCLIALPSKKPLQAAYGIHPKMARQIEQLVSTPSDPFDVIHFEHIRTAEFGRLLLQDHPSLDIPIVWDSVDSITHLFKQGAKQHPRWYGRKLLAFEASRTAIYEPKTAGLFSRVLVTSKTDFEMYQRLLKNQKVNAQIEVIPNGVDLEYFIPGKIDLRKTDTLVISGKMSYHANQKMVLHFVEHILPLIWKKNPTVKLTIVGQKPPQDIIELALDPRITVTGWVEDIRPYLQTATIAVAPLAYGAGIQNKILEAMACETPVIATSTALDALKTIPGENILTADDLEKFADLTIDLLKSPEKRISIGKAGRKYVEAYHSWNFAAEELVTVYQNTIFKG